MRSIYGLFIIKFNHSSSELTTKYIDFKKHDF